MTGTNLQLNKDGKPYPIRLSYSIVAAWLRGDWDNAIAPFLGQDTFSNEAMEQGKKYHRKWEKEALRTGKLPHVFGAGKLADGFATEQKREVWLNDWIQLSGILDLVEGTVGTDYKTGKKNATGYANSDQHKFYKVLAPELTRFQYRCMNQHLRRGIPERVSFGLVHLTDRTLEEGIELILTVAPEIHKYLIDNGVRPEALMRTKTRVDRDDNEPEEGEA